MGKSFPFLNIFSILNTFLVPMVSQIFMLLVGTLSHVSRDNVLHPNKASFARYSLLLKIKQVEKSVSLF